MGVTGHVWIIEEYPAHRWQVVSIKHNELLPEEIISIHIPRGNDND
jgi:hypothetical protein